MTAHEPQVSSWTCLGCGTAWPCAIRRAELLAEYAESPVSLAMMLGAALVRATGDLPYAPAGELHSRFVGWIRRR